MPDWKLLAKKTIFENPFRPVEEWQMQLPNGDVHDYAIETSYDIVIVFGLTDKQTVLLIDEYYIGELRKVKTFVAGLVDKTDHRTTAQNELREEAGCEAREWVYLGSAVKGKYVTGSVHFYLALGVEKKYEQQLEASEDIHVGFVTLDECKQLLRSGALQGALEVACAYHALDYLKLL
jgi:hypothetical protein